MAIVSALRRIALVVSMACVAGCELAAGGTPTSLPALPTAIPSFPALSDTPLAQAPVTPTPAARATFQAALAPSLALAYSTADGVFLWNPQTGERTRIAAAPAARLSWATDGAWLAVTRNPFVGNQLDIVSPDGTLRDHRLESGFAFPVWSDDGGSVLALPCPGTSSRHGDFLTIDPVRGSVRIRSTAEIWSWLPNVAPDLSKALIFPFNRPFQASAVVVFDDWRRAPQILEDADFPTCPDAYAWSPDSHYLAYYGNGRFWLRDMDDPNLSRSLISGPATLKPINAVAPALAWSSSGRQLALVMEGQLWIAEPATLTARRIDGLTGIFSGLSWAAAPRRATPSPDGVLAHLMPHLNPADFYTALAQVRGRPFPRIIAASSDVSARAPFVYLDYAGRKAHIAPPPTRLKCAPFPGVRPGAPALRLGSEQTDGDGREILMVTGGWYMFSCKGTLIYRWDGERLALTVETSATADGN